MASAGTSASTARGKSFDMNSITGDEFRAAMGSFASGVTIVTTLDSAEKPHGMTATAFCSVSKQPPLCLVCVSHKADAYPVLAGAGRFAVNFLSAEQEDLSTRFATHGLDKFENVAYRAGPLTGCPLLDGTLASVECGVQHVHCAGDHDVFIAEILGIVSVPGEPLVYFRGKYHKLEFNTF
jgi:flavin reductase (DIM6/NTAB) family NADH-FMN oxidoreductase RutF